MPFMDGSEACEHILRFLSEEEKVPLADNGQSGNNNIERNAAALQNQVSEDAPSDQA